VQALQDATLLKPFRREGFGYRFDPPGIPAALIFSRITDRRDETTAEVQIVRPDGAHVLRRRINLLSSGRGSATEFAAELRKEVDIDWKDVLRQGCESVLQAHRSGPEVVTIEGDIEPPPPPQWLCDGLLLKDKPNCWLAAASTGKSTLAKAFCAYYAGGMRFLGRFTECGTPLYLDWEDDEGSFRRVVHDVCRHTGVWPVPRMHWLDMHGRRLRDQIEHLGRLIDRYKVGFIVLDAVAAAGGSPGEHLSWEAIALDLEQALGQLPLVTVLGLDHVTSSEHKNGEVPVKARGAERKVEFFRNQWSLMLDQDAYDYGRHVVGWTHTKLNAAPKRPPFVTELLHHDGDLEVCERGIEASLAMIERLTDMKRCLLQLEATPGVSVQEVCEEVYGTTQRSKVETVRTNLKRAQARGLAHVDNGGRWWAEVAGSLAVNGVIRRPFGSEKELPW
jgi:AAA domain